MRDFGLRRRFGRRAGFGGVLWRRVADSPVLDEWGWEEARGGEVDDSQVDDREADDGDAHGSDAREPNDTIARSAQFRRMSANPTLRMHP